MPTKTKRFSFSNGIRKQKPPQQQQQLQQQQQQQQQQQSSTISKTSQPQLDYSQLHAYVQSSEITNISAPSPNENASRLYSPDLSFISKNADLISDETASIVVQLAELKRQTAAILNVDPFKFTASPLYLSQLQLQQQQQQQFVQQQQHQPNEQQSPKRQHIELTISSQQQFAQALKKLKSLHNPSHSLSQAEEIPRRLLATSTQSNSQNKVVEPQILQQKQQKSQLSQEGKPLKQVPQAQQQDLQRQLAHINHNSANSNDNQDDDFEDDEDDDDFDDDDDDEEEVENEDEDEENLLHDENHMHLSPPLSPNPPATIATRTKRANTPHPLPRYKPTVSQNVILHYQQLFQQRKMQQQQQLQQQQQSLVQQHQHVQPQLLTRHNQQSQHQSQQVLQPTIKSTQQTRNQQNDTCSNSNNNINNIKNASTRVDGQLASELLKAKYEQQHQLSMLQTLQYQKQLQQLASLTQQNGSIASPSHVAAIPPILPQPSEPILAKQIKQQNNLSQQGLQNGVGKHMLLQEQVKQLQQLQAVQQQSWSDQSTFPTHLTSSQLLQEQQITLKQQQQQTKPVAKQQHTAPAKIVFSEEIQQIYSNLEYLNPKEKIEATRMREVEFQQQMNNIVDCVGCKDSLQRFLMSLSIEALERNNPIMLDDLIITSKREICMNERLLESNWKIAWFLQSFENKQVALETLNRHFNLFKKQIGGQRNYRCNLHSQKPIASLWKDNFEQIFQTEDGYQLEEFIEIDESTFLANLDVSHFLIIFFSESNLINISIIIFGVLSSSFVKKLEIFEKAQILLNMQGKHYGRVCEAQRKCANELRNR